MKTSVSNRKFYLYTFIVIGLWFFKFFSYVLLLLFQLIQLFTLRIR